MENQTAVAKKKFEIPESLVIIFGVMILASFLTYLIPAGTYDRFTNQAGQTVVDANSFHYIESSPVNPLTVLAYVF